MSEIYGFYISIFGYYNTWMLWATAIFLFFIFLPIYLMLRKKDEYKKFVEFEKYSVIWKWKYKNGDVVGLWCYCPKCNNPLSVDDEHSRNSQMSAKNTFFICNNCGGNEIGRVKGGDRKYVLKLVKNEILRLVKTEQYKDYLHVKEETK
ncbi:MAG: hypothetical protein ACK5LP_08320 [Campylobacteraceae bacterium]